jgi:hypothetical protein
MENMLERRNLTKIAVPAIILAAIALVACQFLPTPFEN